MTLEASEGMQDKTIFIFELDTKKQFFIFYKSASREISTIQKPIKEDARRIWKVVSVFQECWDWLKHSCYILQHEVQRN